MCSCAYSNPLVGDVALETDHLLITSYNKSVIGFKKLSFHNFTFSQPYFLVIISKNEHFGICSYYAPT